MLCFHHFGKFLFAESSRGVHNSFWFDHLGLEDSYYNHAGTDVIAVQERSINSFCCDYCLKSDFKYHFSIKHHFTFPKCCEFQVTEELVLTGFWSYLRVHLIHGGETCISIRCQVGACCTWIVHCSGCAASPRTTFCSAFALRLIAFVARSSKHLQA